MKTWQLLKKNPHLFPRYYIKEYVIKACRKFFEDKEYHELESPILAGALPQERYIDVVTAHLGFKNGQINQAYLIPSTETFNKKILAAGLGNHFVISKVFRGLEDIGPSHSPEFTMLEWYDLGKTYVDLMNNCEDLINYINGFINSKTKRPGKSISYKGNKIDLSTPWPRKSVDELLNEHSSESLSKIDTLESITKCAKSKGYTISADDDWQSIFELIFLNEVEPNLPKDKPCFVYDYPRILCPLTKPSDKNAAVCEKVELYMGGFEIANGYTELLDADEQLKRFNEESTARKKLGKENIRIDLDLIDALRSGLPPVAGMGMGLDRLAMIFADASSISEINYFPANEMFE